LRLDLEVELRDAPGQLTGVLELIGKYGGNIVTVVHDRSRLRSGRVPVRIAFDAPDDGIDPMLEAIRRAYRVLRLGGTRDSHVTAFLLIGHVIQNDLSRVTEQIFNAGAEVRRVRADITGREQPSAVLVDIAAGNERAIRDAMARVEALCREKGFVFLDSVEAPP
jgi:ACT domain-containing protein